jgi:hypothetical protein
MGVNIHVFVSRPVFDQFGSIVQFHQSTVNGMFEWCQRLFIVGWACENTGAIVASEAGKIMQLFASGRRKDSIIDMYIGYWYGSSLVVL